MFVQRALPSHSLSLPPLRDLNLLNDSRRPSKHDASDQSYEPIQLRPLWIPGSAHSDCPIQFSSPGSTDACPDTKVENWHSTRLTRCLTSDTHGNNAMARHALTRKRSLEDHDISSKSRSDSSKVSSRSHTPSSSCESWQCVASPHVAPNDSCHPSPARPELGSPTKRQRRSSEHAHELLRFCIVEHDVSRPHSLGWFDPKDAKVVSVTTFLQAKDWSVNELYEQYFTPPQRETYPNMPKLAGPQPCREQFSDTKRFNQKHHSWVETKRRDRHRAIQSWLHGHLPEVGHVLADHDEELLDLRKSKSKGAKSGKVPGKDDQLYGSVYDKVLGAVLVQAEHTARLQAEAKVEELEAVVAKLKGTGSEVGTISSRRHSTSRSSAKIRGADARGNQRFGHTTGDRRSTESRLPPSPSPSPSATSVPRGNDEMEFTYRKCDGSWSDNRLSRSHGIPA